MAVQNITYDNKSYLNQNADIPATNKVQDIDMNEIKSVVNNNASEITGNATKIANITGQILWTNPNPTSAITSPTVINLEDYDCDILECFYKNSLNSTLRYSTRFFKGYDTRLQILTTDTVLFFRGLNYVSDTSYRIELPYYTGTVSNPNELCIPLYIIGYKTGLFS